MILRTSSLLLLYLMNSYPVLANTDIEIKIALRANRGAEKGMKRWQPTAKYLNNNIPGYSFTMVPFENNSALNQAVSQGNFNFVLTNPASAVEHSIRYGTRHIATLSNKRQGKGYTKFGSVIFTRADRNDIHNLEDLRGKTFMGADEIGFGGWRVAWLELLKHNINPYADFHELRFGGGIQPNVVNAVINGNVDAGSVRTDMLERLAAKGKIKLTELKVLNQKHSTNFPFLRSTDLYPEWSFSRTKSSDADLANRVATLLLTIQETNPAAIKGKYTGWVIPSNYEIVNDLLKELQVGPYHLSSQDIASQFWNKYVGIFAAILLLFLFLLSLTIYIIRTNRHLQQAQNNLEKEMSNRKNVEIILRDLAQQGLVSSKEDSFFNSCLSSLSELYDCKFAMIGLYNNENKTHLKIYLSYSDNKFSSGYIFPIKNSPCEDILKLKL